ncbi:hypothetical protein GNY98_17445 [Escherichia coli]|uniref:toprim domain-containing protein n=1 Tax=Escherichia coli TaxID=562 RepID=UPI0012DE9E44|nr:toprim domain-containing protein [Escherichia coli]MUM94441.1 hypothetical protein [Escherichia coli]
MTKFGKLEAHLLTRNYRHDIHPYRQWIDESEGVVTFPLYRFDGMLAGYQTYRLGAPKQHSNPKMARYFTRSHGRQLLWGTYLPLKDGPIWITESIFKSAAVHNAGGNSWALLGSTFSAGLRRQLAMLPYDFRVIGDNDAAGESLVKSFGKGFVAPDLDELQPHEVSHLIFSHSQ